MSPLVWCDGALLPEVHARVSPLDHGFLFGNGLFETIRVSAFRPQHLERHLDRLIRGAGVLAFPALSRRSLEQAVLSTVSANRLQEGSVKLIVTRGTGGSGPDPRKCWAPSIFAMVRPGNPYPPEEFEAGLTAVISSVRRNHLSPMCRIKSLNFMDNILALSEARSRGAGEAILLNGEGFIAEGSISNVFLVRDGLLVTPPLSAGALPGIIRGLILERAPALGIRVHERNLSPENLARASEAFLTNALMGVMPLVKCDGAPIGNGSPGEVTRELAGIISRC